MSSLPKSDSDASLGVEPALMGERQSGCVLLARGPPSKRAGRADRSRRSTSPSHAPSANLVAVYSATARTICPMPELHAAGSAAEHKLRPVCFDGLSGRLFESAQQTAR